MKASPWEKEDAQHEDIPIIDNHVPKSFVVENAPFKAQSPQYASPVARSACGTPLLFRYPITFSEVAVPRLPMIAKTGAYICEKEGLAAGFRAAKNEKRTSQVE